MSNDSPVAVESDGSIRIVTLARPGVLNAVNAALHNALTRVWGEIAEDPEAAAIVLTGAGRAFSAGGDAEWLQQVASDPAVRWKAIDEGGRLVREMLRCPLPIVAAVNGPAVGLGASVASMCDLIVMSESAFFADPHVQIGIAAGDGVIGTWPGVMGMHRAKEYILLGDRIDARRALELGLANRVTTAADLMDEAIALARRLGALPRYAAWASKRALNANLESSALRGLDAALAAESEHFALPGVAENIRRLSS